MKKFIKKAHQFLQDEEGQSTAEYVLILAIVVMVVMKFKETFVPKIEKTTEGLGGALDKVIDELNSSF